LKLADEISKPLETIIAACPPSTSMVVADNLNGKSAPVRALPHAVSVASASTGTGATANSNVIANASPPGPSLGRLLMDFHSSMRRLRSFEGRGDSEASEQLGTKDSKAKQPWEQGNSEDEANDDHYDVDDDGRTSVQKPCDWDMRMSLDSGYNDNDMTTKTQ